MEKLSDFFQLYCELTYIDILYLPNKLIVLNYSVLKTNSIYCIFFFHYFFYHCKLVMKGRPESAPPPPPTSFFFNAVTLYY